jgi:hypothetical protein
MKRLLRINYTTLFMAVMMYATVLIYQGYQYGDGDQSQILPCLYAQDHPGSYTTDHYVSSYLDARVNERTIFHFLFRFLGYQHPWIVWLWHALLSITLILAWLKIADLGLRSKVYQYLAVIFILILGHHTSVGSNELYYNMVIPSLAAKALGSWALYYWLRADYNPWLMLLLGASFLQPLVGFQLFLLTFLALSFEQLLQKKVKELPWKQILIYLVITIPWIILLGIKNGGIDHPGLFMDIMEFRLSHHFFPSYFGWQHLAIFCMLGIIGVWFYKQRLRWFVIIILLGCIIYTIAVEKYHAPLALYSQWWKTTIWLEALGCVALAVGHEKGIPNLRFFSKYVWTAPVVILLLIGTYRFSGWFGQGPEYMFPWTKTKSDEVDISEHAAALTPDDAVFIIPIDFTAFRWYSKRNLYVDYKALFHQEQFLNEWYKRIENIYAYGLKEKKGEFDIHVFSKALLEEPTLISTDYWTKLGITHIVSTSPGITSLKKLYSNDTYSIYSLQ